MTSPLRAADPYADITFDPHDDAARTMLAAVLTNPRRPEIARHAGARWRLVTATVASLVAAVAVLVLATTSLKTEHRNVALGPPGYRVAAQADGSVQVVVKWSEVREPAELQRSLDSVDARTKIWVTGTNPTSTWCDGSYQPFTGHLDPDVISYHTASGEDGLVIRPNHFPIGVTLLITVEVERGAPTQVPTGTIGDRSMAGFATVWATGPVSACA